VEWLVDPLALIALLAASMVACAVLFFTLKKEIAEGEARHRAECHALETALSEVRTSLDELRQAVEDPERRAAVAARPLAGMNLHKRGQVLRLHRRGERPEQIAAALGLPLNEVDLLVKVHRTLSGPPA
jgi:Flp pilus assembly protein TadB